MSKGRTRTGTELMRSGGKETSTAPTVSPSEPTSSTYVEDVEIVPLWVAFSGSELTRKLGPEFAVFGFAVALSAITSLIARLEHLQSDSGRIGRALDTLFSLKDSIAHDAIAVSETFYVLDPSSQRYACHKYTESPTLVRPLWTFLSLCNTCHDVLTSVPKVRWAQIFRRIRGSRSVQSLTQSQFMDGALLNEICSHVDMLPLMYEKHLLGTQAFLGEVTVKAIMVLPEVMSPENDPLLLERRILLHLQPSEASYESTLHNHKSFLHHGTRQKVLDALSHWISDPKEVTRMVFLHGSAGAGKSTIVYALAKLIDLEQPTVNGGRKSKLGATYFCNPTDDCNELYRVFPTIAYQLAHNLWDLRAVIVNAVVNSWSHPHPEQLEYQCEHLVLNPLRHLEGQPEPVIIIMDGVDQLDHLDTLLHLLSQVARELPFLRILISGRSTDSYPGPMDAIQINLDDSDKWDVTSDLLRFIEDELSAYARRSKVDLLQQRTDAIRSLVALANGSFLVATATMQYVLEYPEHSVERLDCLLSPVLASVADTISAGMNPEYHHVIHLAFNMFERHAGGISEDYIHGAAALSPSADPAMPTSSPLHLNRASETAQATHTQLVGLVENMDRLSSENSSITTRDDIDLQDHGLHREVSRRDTPTAQSRAQILVHLRDLHKALALHHSLRRYQQRSSLSNQSSRNHRALEKLEPSPASFTSRQTEEKSHLLPGTRATILQDLRNWAQDNGSSHKVWIIRGPAGVGKSTIAHAFATMLHDIGYTCLSFFFSSADPACQDPYRIFPTLTHQLAFARPELLSHIASCMEKGLAPLSSQNTYHQILNFARILSAMETRPRRPLMVVIDDVDECLPHQRDAVRKMISLICAISREFAWLRVVITCRTGSHFVDSDGHLLGLAYSGDRPHPASGPFKRALLSPVRGVTFVARRLLRTSVETTEDAGVAQAPSGANHNAGIAHHTDRIVEFLELEKKSKNVQEDIRQYVKEALINSRLLSSNRASRSEMIDEVTELADGFFLYARILVDFFIDDGHYSAISHKFLVESNGSNGPLRLYSKLDELYIDLLNCAFGNFRGEVDRMASIHQLLTWIALARSSFSTEELERIGIPRVAILDVTSRLGAVALQCNERNILPRPLDSPSVILRPYHASFRHFLVNDLRCRDPYFYVDAKAGNGDIAVALMDYLVTSADIYEKEELEFDWMHTYAYLEWANHVCMAEYNEKLGLSLRTFLERMSSDTFSPFESALGEVSGQHSQAEPQPRGVGDIRDWYSRQKVKSEDLAELLHMAVARARRSEKLGEPAN